MRNQGIVLFLFLFFLFSYSYPPVNSSTQVFDLQISRSKVAGVPGASIQYKINVRNLTSSDLNLEINTEILETPLSLYYTIHHQQQEIKNNFKVEKTSSKTLDIALQTTEQTPIKTQGILRVSMASKAHQNSNQAALLYFYVVDEIAMHLNIGSKHVHVRNQDPYVLDYPPYIRDSRTFVPLRFIGESFGATIGWDQRERKVTYTLRGKNLTLWINQTRYVINGIEKRMDVAPEIKPPGRTFVPVRLISEELGATVRWLAENQEIRIEYKISS